MVWDDFYGPISPGEIVSRLEPAVTEVGALADSDVNIPPELERLFTACMRLYRAAAKVIEDHDS